MATSTPSTSASAPFFVPFPMAAATAVFQEPKSTSDTPTPTAPAGPAGGATPAPGSTQAPGTPGPAPSGMPCGMDSSTLLLMAGMFGILYFMMIRPENKRRKQQQEMLAAIKVGDTVVTLGGMHGVVASLAEKTVTLRLDTQKVVFDRTAIARVERHEAPAGDKKS